MPSFFFIFQKAMIGSSKKKNGCKKISKPRNMSQEADDHHLIL